MWASDCQVYTDYLRLEHKQIHEVVAEIEAAIRGADRVEGNPPVATKLGELRDLLVRHFEQEEDGGCLDQAACCCPRLSKAVTRITGEHKSLLGQLDGLIDTARDGRTVVDVGDFCQLLTTFTKHLNAHDAAENHVLEEAFGSG